MIDTDDFLEHYGVAGMKWGKRKAQVVTGSQRAPRASRDRQLALREKYTNKQALATRTKAGKMAGSAALLAMGSMTLSAISSNSKNPSVAIGAAAASRFLAGATGIVATGAAVTGYSAVRQENAAREKKS